MEKGTDNNYKIKMYKAFMNVKPFTLLDLLYTIAGTQHIEIRDMSSEAILFDGLSDEFFAMDDFDRYLSDNVERVLSFTYGDVMQITVFHEE